jgi:hypothetical protein
MINKKVESGDSGYRIISSTNINWHNGDVCRSWKLVYRSEPRLGAASHVIWKFVTQNKFNGYVLLLCALNVQRRLSVTSPSKLDISETEAS